MTLFFTGLVTGLVLFVAGLALHLGRLQQEARQERKTHDTENKARIIRDRLEHDPAYRQRVRDHFTR